MHSNARHSHGVLLLLLQVLSSSFIVIDAAQRPNHLSEDSTAWLSQQDTCSQWLTARRQMTESEQALVTQNVAKRWATSSGGVSQSSSEDWCPALLWTFTGTGNSMTRMLIEAASGWYTGSAYTDLSLVDILPGEYLCGAGVVAVKAHPQWHSFASLTPEGLRPDTPHVPPDAKELCPCNFNRAMAVIRDPYATFLAEYKRLRTHDYNTCSHSLADGQSCQGGHVSVIQKDDFNATDFRVEVLRMADEWAAMFDSYDAFAAAHPQGFYLTTFEELTHHNTRTQALAGILHALGVPPHLTPHPHQSARHTCSVTERALSIDKTSSTDDLLHINTLPAVGLGGPEACTPGALSESSSDGLRGYDQHRLECAFQLARHPAIYRPKDPEGIDADYVYGRDSRLVCDIWRVVGRRAAAHGYKPYGGKMPSGCGVH